MKQFTLKKLFGNNFVTLNENLTLEKFENKKLYLTYLNAQNSYNPSLLYNSLKNESENDIDYGLRLLGYN